MSAAAQECAGSLRSPAELADTSGVDLGPVQGVAVRPMSAVRAEKLERARCASLNLLPLRLLRRPQRCQPVMRGIRARPACFLS